MITTRNIKAEIPKQVGRLKQVITKDIDTSSPMPENPIPNSLGISTGNIADAGDIQEKKRRDEIMEEKSISLKAEVLPLGENDKGFNLQYAIVEIDELLQGISRRELK